MRNLLEGIAALMTACALVFGPLWVVDYLWGSHHPQWSHLWTPQQDCP